MFGRGKGKLEHSAKGHLTTSQETPLGRQSGALDYSQILEKLPTAACIFDAAGTLQARNSKMTELFVGYKIASASGVGSYNLFHNTLLDSDSLDQIKCAFSQSKSLSIDVDWRSHEPSNSFNKAHIELEPLIESEAAGRFICQIWRRSDDKGLQVLGNQHQFTLARIFQMSGNAVAVKDEEGKYLLANDSFIHLFGFEGVSVIGKTNYDLFPKDQASYAEFVDGQVLESGEFRTMEESVTLADGYERNFLVSRFPIISEEDGLKAVCVTASDITYYKDIERESRERHLEMQVLLDGINSIIWYTDRWGRIKSCNRRAEEWLPLTEARGKIFMEVTPDWDDPAERQREIMHVIRTGVPIINTREAYGQGADQCYFRVDKIPTKNTEGIVTGVIVMMIDITTEVMKEKALKISEARYRAFIANSSEAVFCYEIDPPIDTSLSHTQQVQLIHDRAVISECNQKLADMFQVKSSDELLGMPVRESSSVTRKKDLVEFVENSYRVEEQQSEFMSSSGNRSFFSVTALGTLEDGHLTRIWGTAKDVTENTRHLEKMEYQATHDSLTLLPNRNKLYQDLEQELKGDPKWQVGLLLMDLDRFKEINDTLGHHAGDQLLKQIGPRLEVELCDTPAMIARLGGDEFAILLPKIRNPQRAVVIAHRIIDAIKAPFDIDGLHTEISASIGISIYPDQATDVSTMMRCADVAMYYAKTEKLGITLYTPDIDQHTPKRLAMMNDLGRALREDQLTLHFQPKISISNGAVIGFEALLRWQHPELGFVPPGEFIPLVEMTDMINPMTKWVLEQSVMQAKRWQEQGYDFVIAANLSTQNLLDETLVDFICETLAFYECPPRLIELEITESSIMADPQRSLRVLESIHELGVGMSIDDYGTGYSSLAYIKRLPVDALKIDFSFVRNILVDETDDIIVHSTIQLAHNLGLDVVAEGVEEQDVLDRLLEMKCNHAQGYHILKPMPEAKINEWLQDCPWSPNRA